MRKNKRKIFGVAFLITIVIVALFTTLGGITYARGLVEDTTGGGNLFNALPLMRYQLDYHDSGGGFWSRWSLTANVASQVNFGLYIITNALWAMGLWISSAAGYVVQEAFRFDLIGLSVEHIASNIQNIAGISRDGRFISGGLFSYLIPFIIVGVGAYVGVVGGIKKQTSKAVSAILNLVIVGILSLLFIASAATYINRINSFSTELANAALTAGIRMVNPDGQTQSNNSTDSTIATDAIRDILFDLQIRQPWLILQFGSTNMEEIGTERIAMILGYTHNSDARLELIESEVDDLENTHMSPAMVGLRFGTFFVLGIFSFGVSLFAIFLSAKSILVQILFILFATYLPISLLLSLIPGFESTARRAIMKLFNIILMRAGVIFIMVGTFSIVTLVFSMTGSTPFLIVLIIQIAVLVGAYTQFDNILDMMSLRDGSGSHSVGQKLMNPLRRTATRGTNRILGKVIAGGIGLKAGKAIAGRGNSDIAGNIHSGKANDKTDLKSFGKVTDGSIASTPGRNGSNTKNVSAGNRHGGMYGSDRQVGKHGEKHSMGNESHSSRSLGNPSGRNHGNGKQYDSLGSRLGRNVGAIKDAPVNIRDKAIHGVDTLHHMPTNIQDYGYRVRDNVSGKIDDIKTSVEENADDFKKGIQIENQNRKDRRLQKREEIMNQMKLKREHSHTHANIAKRGKQEGAINHINHRSDTRSNDPTDNLANNLTNHPFISRVTPITHFKKDDVTRKQVNKNKIERLRKRA